MYTVCFEVVCHTANRDGTLSRRVGFGYECRPKHFHKEGNELFTLKPDKLDAGSLVVHTQLPFGYRTDPRGNCSHACGYMGNAGSFREDWSLSLKGHCSTAVLIWPLCQRASLDFVESFIVSVFALYLRDCELKYFLW